MAHPSLTNENRIIDIIKYRWLWLAISVLLLLPCVLAIGYSMITYPNHAPMKVGIDFTGGTILQYGIEEKVSIEQMADIRNKLIKAGVENPVIQNIDNQAIAESSKNSIQHLLSIKTSFIDEKSDTVNTITSVLSQDLKNPELIQTSSVGPTLGKELLKNSMVALLLAFLGIVLYINMRFKLDYAVIVLLSLFHDAIFVIGIFSILSLFFGVQVDSLFITAILTVIGFSVHDTIVVFDRIRENSRFLAKKHTVAEIINASVNQTFARSINTSLTTLMTLLALYFFGGSTIKDFVLAMILGIIVGTYSSIFFASVLLDIWEERKQKKALAR